MRVWNTISHAGKIGVSSVVNVVRTASTAQKLAAAFALFLVPLAYVSAKLASEQQREIAIAQQERIGSNYLAVVNEARRVLYTELRAEQIGRENVISLTPVIRGLQAAERRYGEGLGSSEVVGRAVFSLQVMQDNERARHTAANAATAALFDLAMLIGDRSTVARDADLDGAAAASVLLWAGDRIAQQTRDITADAGRAAADGRISESERAIIEQRLVTLDNNVHDLDIVMEAQYAASPDNERQLSPAAYATLTNIAAYANGAQRMLSSGHINANTLVAMEAGVHATLSDLTDRVAAGLNQRLDARVRSLSEEGLITFLMALFLFIATLGAVVAMLRIGLVEPIDSLSASIRAIADGRYDADIPAQNREDELGDMARALAILRDTAEAKIAADAARGAAESANVAKSRFVAAMTHELRTPLNAILGYAEMLAEDAEDRGDTASQADLERINTAARHLLAVINDILDLSKIEAGRMDILAAPSDPMAIADECVATLKPLAEKNGNTLHVDLADIRTGFVDAQKLRQCLINLLSNACKFTRNGDITLTLRQEGEDADARLIFTVRDTGIGISPEQMSRLFRPFEQANSAVTRQYGGTGLGLMITRRMAELMGGEVRVESALGAGAAFTVAVPQFYRGFGAGGSADVSQREGAEDAPLVVVIDDEPSARDLVMRTLTPLGFAVQGARTAAAGLDLVRTAKPALVVLDVNLPDRKGWTILPELQQDLAAAHIPVIVLSIEEDRRRSLELGAAEHLVKPASRERICAAVLRFARARTATPDAPADDAAARLSA